MSQVFFKDPFWIYILLVAVELVLLIAWWRAPEGKGWKRLLVPLVLGGVVFTVEALVETDGEKIEKAVRAVARDVEKGEIRVLESLLHRDFRGDYLGSELDKKETLELALSSMEKYRPTVVEVRSVDPKIEGNHAFVVVLTRMRLRSLPTRATLLLRWEVEWDKVDGKWLLVSGTTPHFGM